MAFLFFALAVACGCIYAYMYFFIKRAWRMFSESEMTRYQKIATRLFAVCIGAVAVTVFGYGLIFILYMAMFDALISLIWFLLRKITKKKREEMHISVKVLKSGVVPAVLSAILVVAGIINFHNVVKTEYTVFTDKNIREEGYKVAFISDVHFGTSLDIPELSRVCEEISLEKPDIVILGGDIVDSSTPGDSLIPLFETLGNIESRYGVFYVYGNHDRPMRGMPGDVLENELDFAIEQGGIKILSDETVEINDDFVIAGREDRGFDHSYRMPIDELLSKADKDKFILTLDHQPSEYAENERAGSDLILSGHTHGGQIWPVNIVDNIFKMNEANYGYIEIGKDTSAIVSSGLAGWGFRIKTSAPAEYVIVNIKEK